MSHIQAESTGFSDFGHTGHCSQEPWGLARISYSTNRSFQGTTWSRSLPLTLRCSPPCLSAPNPTQSWVSPLPLTWVTWTAQGKGTLRVFEQPLCSQGYCFLSAVLVPSSASCDRRMLTGCCKEQETRAPITWARRSGRVRPRHGNSQVYILVQIQVAARNRNAQWDPGGTWWWQRPGQREERRHWWPSQVTPSTRVEQVTLNTAE